GEMCRLAGYTRGELIGSAFKEYFADPERATEGVGETFEKGVVTDYVLTLRPREGAPIEVSFNASVFKDSTGEVGGFFASARDITEQSPLQRRLGDEQTYTRGLIEASVDGLVTVNQEKVITDVNETMCRMVGRPRAQLIETPFTDYFLEGDRAREGVEL